MCERTIKKLDCILDTSKQQVELDKLRATAWLGVPSTEAGYRCRVWKLLLDYLPTD